MSRRRRRVAIVTGTRAEYGVLRSLLAGIARRRGMELQLVVTGMHLLRQFGHTVDTIRADGWPIAARVPMQRGDDSPTDQADGLARGIRGIAKYFEQARTDVVVVLGDRIEALAGALAAVTTGRVLAHIHGGDVAPGDFDDSMRHAITKLAHVHFAATKQAGRRIVRMGEDTARVYVVGAPGLDDLRTLLKKKPRVERAQEALVVYHAHGREPAVEARVMKRLLEAVARAGLQRTILYPNTDRGHQGVLRAIEGHVRKSAAGEVSVTRSLPRPVYLEALLRAKVLVGNSSSGIIEAPLAGTPSVNVGDRQAGRELGGSSVISCGESASEISGALCIALRKRPRPGGQSVYGDGQAGERIAKILAGLKLTSALVRKVIAY